MSMTKLQTGAVLAMVAAGAAGLIWQYRTNARLEARLADLPALRAENARLRGESRRLEQASAEVEHLRAEHAELVRLRGKLAAPPAPGATGAVPLAAGLTPVESLGNAGRATPRAAFATQLWAARTGDVALEASAIMLSPEGRARLEALMAALPDDVRARYEPPEKLMALALADSPHPVGGMQVLGETTQDPDDVTLQTAWQHADDSLVHHSDVQMHLTADGWKLVVPPILVNLGANFLTRRAAAGNGGP